MQNINCDAIHKNASLRDRSSHLNALMTAAAVSIPLKNRVAQSKRKRAMVNGMVNIVIVSIAPKMNMAIKAGI